MSGHKPSLLDDETPPDPKAHGPFAALRRVLPSGEVIRFLLVGGSNTLISLGLYSGFVLLFSRLLPHHGKLPLRPVRIVGALESLRAAVAPNPSHDGIRSMHPRAHVLRDDAQQ